jgi:Fic family protein
MPAVAERLHQILLAKGVRATTAIEGNTLSQEEVERRIAGKRELPPSREYLGQEVDNIVKGLNKILHRIGDEEPRTLSADRIKDYNRIVLDQLALDEGVVPGEIRSHDVVVGDYRGAPAEDCEYLLERMCEWLNASNEWVLDARPEATGILKAILAHLYIAWIHPFGDGNGRTARLVEYEILVSDGIPSAAAHLLSNHYNETRSEYYRHLDIANKEIGGAVRFIKYALQGLVDGLREQLQVVRQQQLTIAWRDYVRWAFRERRTTAGQRQQDVVLALSPSDQPVPATEIRRLTPGLAEAYASKTSKTISRDLNALIKMGLIERVQGSYRARTETILAFLPLRRAHDKQQPTSSMS